MVMRRREGGGGPHCVAYQVSWAPEAGSIDGQGPGHDGNAQDAGPWHSTPESPSSASSATGTGDCRGQAQDHTRHCKRQVSHHSFHHAWSMHAPGCRCAVHGMLPQAQWHALLRPLPLVGSAPHSALCLSRLSKATEHFANQTLVAAIGGVSCIGCSNSRSQPQVPGIIC